MTNVIRLFNTFTSIQWESESVGLPCFFIRLAGCPLRCRYCDTRAACDSPGEAVSVDELVHRFVLSGVRRVEVTGGEPLFQEGTARLLSSLCDTGKIVMLETAGCIPVNKVDPRVHVVMDVKCPDSGSSNSFVEANLSDLSGRPHELKFVISSRRDFDWTVEFVHRHDLSERKLLISPVVALVSFLDIASWVMGSGIDFRLQAQLHRVIWPEGGDNR